MRFYRVAHVATDWETSRAGAHENGHPLYVHRQGQGKGRFDLPVHYLALYMARQPQAAVGELFQAFASWPVEEIARQRIVDGEPLPRCLVAIDTDMAFLDLDDPALLDAMGWRPSDVVNKDRVKTQELALTQWLRRSEHGKAGFIWWSSCQPAWTVAMAWADPIEPTYDGVVIADVEELDADHNAVIAAASALKRPIV